MCQLPQYQGHTALVALAAEVAYDRALIKLCEAHSIEVVDMNFLHPRQERARLEAALVAAGIDLACRGRGQQT
jgi:hypothetical protein